jgi:hypothetical protein
MKCPENVMKSTLRPISFFFFNQWIDFNLNNVKYIGIYLTNIKKETKKKNFLGGNNLT